MPLADISLTDRRKAEVAATVARVRTIVSKGVPTPQTLDKIKGALCNLAARAELFTFDEFPLPEKDSGPGNCLYRISEDKDHRYALYVNASHPGKNSAPHNHTTWAVVVGVRGAELNRLYQRVDDASIPGKGQVREVSEFSVVPGTGICFMPEDIHSIHVIGKEPILHLHMYGLGLEQLDRRIGFDTAQGACTVYPPHRDIRSVP